MKKRIWLIGNTDGLPGVKTDLQNYKRFFKSAYGGCWTNEEIIESVNARRLEIIGMATSLRTFNLDYLIIIFSGHGGQYRETFLELNADGELVAESELTQITRRQLNIYDCCRAYPELTEQETRRVEAKFYSTRNTRQRYETRIMQAHPQQVSLYACQKDELAHETNEGGAYSRNLLKCSTQFKGDSKLVGTNHQEATLLTNLEFPLQHPDAVLPRLLKEQQLIFSVNP